MWECLESPVLARTPLEPVRLYIFNGRVGSDLPVSPTFRGYSRQQGAATCRGAIIRTLTAAGIKGKPEGKLGGGEGRCKNTPTSTQKEQKKRKVKSSSLKAGSAVRTDDGQAAALSTAISEPSVFLSKHQSALRG